MKTTDRTEPKTRYAAPMLPDGPDPHRGEATGARRGTVLILVVGILAVLMLLAATLALVSRMELKTSRYYADAQQAEAIVDGIEDYCRYVLHWDKFGADGYAYDYDYDPNAGDFENETNPGPGYPTDGSRTWDDENFDSYQNEEWLPGTETGWRLFPTVSGISWAEFRNNPDDFGLWIHPLRYRPQDDPDNPVPYAVRWRPLSSLGNFDFGSLLGGDVQARVALYFVDVGGARIDVNSTGRLPGANGPATMTRAGSTFLHFTRPDGGFAPAQGDVITGQTGDATGSVVTVDGPTLWLSGVDGAFLVGEEITCDSGGSAVVSYPYTVPGRSGHELDPGQTVKALLLDNGADETTARTTALDALADLLGARYGPGSPPRPGLDAQDDLDISNANPEGDGDGLDGNYDGQIDEGDIDGDGLPDDQTDVPTEFDPVWPVGNDRPFGVLDLHDLFWGARRGSRVAEILTPPLLSVLPPDQARPQLTHFTTHSGGTVVAGRSLTSADEWMQTAPVAMLGRQGVDDDGDGEVDEDLVDGQDNDGDGKVDEDRPGPSLPFLARNMPWDDDGDGLIDEDPVDGVDNDGDGYIDEDPVNLQSASTGEGLPVARSLDLAELCEDPDEDGVTAGDVAAFLVELGARDGTGDDNDLAADSHFVRQTALNLLEMVDTDDDMLEPPADWEDADEPDYLGVEPVPYVAEVEAEINTANSPYMPNPNGSVTGNGGQRQTGDEPFTGWGKYIKLVNPWDRRIVLRGQNATEEDSNYRLIVRGGQAWAWVWIPGQGPPGGQPPGPPFPPPGQGRWDEGPLPVPGGGPGLPEVPIEKKIYFDQGDFIPARGHFLVIDSEDAPGGVGTQDPFDTLPEAENYCQDTYLTYMREEPAPQGGGQQGQQAYTEIFLQKRDPNGNWRNVMHFDVPDETGEDDTDGTPQTQSVQVGDPRPCWDRNGGGGGGGQGNPLALWGNEAWQAEERTKGEWSDETVNLDWFNRNWRSDTDPDEEMGGDGWFKLYAPAEDEPPSNPDNLLDSFPPVARTGRTGVWNCGRLPNSTYLGYVHVGRPWETVSLKPKSGVWFSRLYDYVVGPHGNPYEDGFDNDADGATDADDRDLVDNLTGNPQPDGLIDGGPTDRAGPEIRVHGRINVNTAPEAVLRAALNREELLRWAAGEIVLSGGTLDADAVRQKADDMAQQIAEAIVQKRQESPFTSVADFLERMDDVFGDFQTDTSVTVDSLSNDTHLTYRCESLARFMAGLVTVRTDVWGVVGRVQLFRDWDDSNNPNARWDPGEPVAPEDILADRKFYMVLDRSRDPMRMIMKRYLPE